MNGAIRRPASPRNAHPRRSGAAARIRSGAPAALAALLLAVVLGACGGEVDEQDVVEGEAARLGELEYHVQLTRFLNPADTTDAEYLVGQPRPPAGESYLGTFVRIDNEDDERDLRSSEEYTLVDIRGNRYEPLESDSPFALEIGALVPAGSQLPLPDSMAAVGPARGGVLLFLVDVEIAQRLPLSLEIVAEEGTATVQLDI